MSGEELRREWIKVPLPAGVEDTAEARARFAALVGEALRAAPSICAVCGGSGEVDRAALSTEPALDVERLATALRDHCHDSADEGPPIFLRHGHIAPFLTDECAPAIARRYARLAESQS